MAEESEHLHLDDGQKSRLLGFALAADKPPATSDANERRGDLFCDLLRCSLPAHEVPDNSDVPTTNGSRGGLGSIFGPSIRELLLDRQTDVATLQRVKEYTKMLGRDAGSDIEKDVFLAIYFAAIAGAMVFHGERITGHSDQDLRRFFGSFASAPWMPTELAGLFSRAAHTVISLDSDD